jgi:pseudo-rSAM protein
MKLLKIQIMNKKYWLYIEPFVYIHEVSNNVIMLNTLNEKYISIKADNNAYSLVEQLIEKKNNYVIEIDLSVSIDIINFIKKIKKFYMGDIIPIENSLLKPFQFKPHYKIFNYDYFDDMKESYIIKNGKTINNIRDVSFYINSVCYQNCSFCNTAYKQFNICHKSNDNTELDFDKLKENIEKFSYSSVNQINFNGGNIVKYYKFSELITFLNTIKKNINIYIDYMNIIDAKDFFSFFQSEGKVLKIYIHPPFNQDLLIYIKKFFKKYNFEIIFIIQSEKDFLESNKIVNEFDFKAYIFQPLFKNNLSFFKKNVYNTKKDILEREIEMSEIIINNEINSFYFGSMIIMNNGLVYSNLNTPSIGNIITDSLQKIMINALDKKGSWKKIRKNEEPCCQCVYNVFCPPIGNYEHAIGMNNLCKIKN